MKLLLLLCFGIIAASVSTAAPALQKFDPPLLLRDGAVVSGGEAPTWIRACASQSAPWALTFAEWQSFFSEKALAIRPVDEARFREYAAKPRSEAERWHSILATAWLKGAAGDYLLVVSNPGRLDRFPREQSGLEFASLGLLLLKRHETGWRVVDPGTDLPMDDLVVKEMLSVGFSDLGITGTWRPANRPSEPAAGPDRSGTRQP